MDLHRSNPLPVAASRGRLIVSAAVAAETRCALQSFEGPDGRHEGLVLWAGRRAGDDVVVLSAVRPQCDHGRQYVFVDEREFGKASRLARSVGLAIVAQVHSHPGHDTRHSDGDDRLVLMPHEGMFSLVVADFGRGWLLPGQGGGLHQYQDGRWVQIPPDAGDGLIVVPPQLQAQQ